MTFCELYFNALRHRASANTQHRFFKRYENSGFVEKLFNTVYALGELKPDHELMVGSDSFKRDDYVLPDALNIAVWNYRVYMSKNDAGRCKPVLESTVKADPSVGYLTPDEIRWLVNDYNDKQTDAQFKITLVPTNTDRSLAFQDLRDVAIGGRTYQFSGEVDVESLSQFLCFSSPVDWNGLVPDYISVSDEEVVKWLLNT